MFFNNRGARDSAVVHLERAFALRDKLSLRERLLVEAGHAQVVRGDSEAALTAYLALLEQYPNEPTALNNAGVQATNLGRTEEAIGFYRRAIAVGAAPALSYTNLIAALINRGDVAAADTAFGLFTERFPEARNLPVYRSNLALARSDFSGRRRRSSRYCPGRRRSRRQRTTAWPWSRRSRDVGARPSGSVARPGPLTPGDLAGPPTSSRSTKGSRS